MEIKHWPRQLFSLLFPKVCNACGTPLFTLEKHLCTICLSDLPFTDYHLYPANRVAKQFWGKVNINHAMAILYFRKSGKVQNIIHQLKYFNKKDLGIFLGELMAKKINESPFINPVDLIIPVPLHPKKLKVRGYNQSSFLAKGVSNVLKVPLIENVLLKTAQTESQTKKNRYSRFENMQDVFTINQPEVIKDKHILLIDDVTTTGSTLESCAQVLLTFGVKKISICTVAYSE